MVAIKARDADRFLARPDPIIRLVLLYGPDTGRSSARADALAQSLAKVGGEIVRLDGDAVSADPDILMNEAYGSALFAPVAVIRVREGQRSLATALTPLLSTPPDRMVIVEAGDLKPTSPTRKLVEKAENAAALGSYSEDSRGIGDMIDRTLSSAGVTIDPMARDVLITRLGADHLVSRSELEKLVVYIHPRSTITLDDVSAICGDTSAALRDDFVDAVAGCRADLAVKAFQSLMAEGLAPVPLVSQLVRHFTALHRAVSALAMGRGKEEALKAFVPPLHFKRRPVVEASLRRWTPQALMVVLSRLQDAELAVRLQTDLSEALVERLIFQICATQPKDAQR